jgi:coenzyme F420-reducing hydrogenase beta subunit
MKKPIKVIGARYKNDTILTKSASGGVFAGVASKILETSGNAVFGCAFDENIVAKHICVTDIKDIEPLQSSKYVQSNVGETYLHTKKLLDGGKTVFYTGCPCQIAGLYAFLEKDYVNLVTADLICHGVPSPLLFKRYIDTLSEKLCEKITYYNFRSKCKQGWKLKVKTRAKTKTMLPNFDPYYNGFLSNKAHRECCYTCRYASTQRVGDITLGDFWGVDDFHPEFYDKRGVSVVLINSTKGEQLIQEISGAFEIIDSNLENIVKYQKNLQMPSQRHKYRDVVYKDIQQLDYNIFAEKTLRPGMFAYCMQLYRILPIPLSSKVFLRRVFKKIIGS